MGRSGLVDEAIPAIKRQTVALRKREAYLSGCRSRLLQYSIVLRNVGGGKKAELLAAEAMCILDTIRRIRRCSATLEEALKRLELTEQLPGDLLTYGGAAYPILEIVSSELSLLVPEVADELRQVKGKLSKLVVEASKMLGLNQPAWNWNEAERILEKVTDEVRRAGQVREVNRSSKGERLLTGERSSY